MSVYLGRFGQVELKRQSFDGLKYSVVNPSDINTSKKRFSFDFDIGLLHSGDQLEIRSTDGSILSFVAAAGWGNTQQQSSGTWYIHVDELGGIRLFSTFDAALEGLSANAIALSSIASNIPISVKIVNSIPHLLAQCTSFELNTNRETVDTTALGEEFRSTQSSLISGSGNLRAIWEYLPTEIDGNPAETVHYLMQLALRTEIGSGFSAKLYIKTAGDYSLGTAADDELWYEIDAIVTQAGVSYGADAYVEVAIDFVTTGPIRLRAKTIPINKILQENTDDILLEQDATARLLQEAVD